MSIGGAGSDIVVPAAAPGRWPGSARRTGSCSCSPRRRRSACCTTARVSPARRGCAAATCSTSAVVACACDVEDGRADARGHRGRRGQRHGAAGSSPDVVPACRARAAMKRRSRRSLSGDRAAASRRESALPWRRVGIAAGARAARRAGWVSVHVGPGAASTSIRCRSVWPSRAAGPDVGFGASRLLRPGKYTLVAEHEGYETLRVPIEITRDGKRQFRFSLKALPGRLRIELPVAGTGEHRRQVGRQRARANSSSRADRTRS